MRSSSNPASPEVRIALAALGITVEDLSDQGVCKAALIMYYQGPNTAESEVEATKALRQEGEKANAPKAALADQTRVKETAEALRGDPGDPPAPLRFGQPR